MKPFVERMIEEHSQLCVRISKLHDYVYSSLSDKDNKVEFANKAIQLAAMKKYEEALRARLANQGIYIEDGQYFEKVADIQDSFQDEEPCKAGRPENTIREPRGVNEVNCKTNEDIDFGND